MPFTASHAAAALPLHRWLGRYGVLSALVIGCCVPDLPYFLPLGVSRQVSHSAFGLFYYCLPAGLVCYFLFHTILKQPLLLLLPPQIGSRLVDPACLTQRLPTVPWLALAVSLLAGAASHLVWDSFTHADGAAVKALGLQQPLFVVYDYTLYRYSLLQHASSVLGLLLLWRAGARWLANAPPFPLPAAWSTQQRWLVIIAIIVAACAGAGMLAMQIVPSSLGLQGVRTAIGKTSIAALRSLGVSILLYGLAWQISRFGNAAAERADKL